MVPCYRHGNAQTTTSIKSGLRLKVSHLHRLRLNRRVSHRFIPTVMEINVSMFKAVPLQTEPLYKCTSRALQIDSTLSYASSSSYDCNGTPSQNWNFVRGSTHVKLDATNFCLDAGSGACRYSSRVYESYFDIRSVSTYERNRHENLGLFRRAACTGMVLHRQQPNRVGRTEYASYRLISRRVYTQY